MKNENNKDINNSCCKPCYPSVPQGRPSPFVTSYCECVAGLRAVLGYLKDIGATYIRVETIAQSPSVNNKNIVRFYPDANDASTALLVEFSDHLIVSICEIENIQSMAFIDSSDDQIPDVLKASLDFTRSQTTSELCNCCEVEMRKLFATKTPSKMNLL